MLVQDGNTMLVFELNYSALQIAVEMTKLIIRKKMLGVMKTTSQKARNRVTQEPPQINLAYNTCKLIHVN